MRKDAESKGKGDGEELSNERTSEDGDANENEARKRTMEKEEVPTVSLELYEKDFAGFVRALGEAYERYGFVILENHGIPQEMIERAMDRSKAFFACDELCKKKYTLAGLGGARGYTAFGVETAKGATAPGKCAFSSSFLAACAARTTREPND